MIDKEEEIYNEWIWKDDLIALCLQDFIKAHGVNNPQHLKNFASSWKKKKEKEFYNYIICTEPIKGYATDIIIPCNNWHKELNFPISVKKFFYKCDAEKYDFRVR